MAAENTLKKFQRAKGDDTKEVVRNLQTNLEQSLDFTTRSAIIDGRLVGGVDLDSAATKTFLHRLGRQARGAIVVSQEQQGRIEVRGLDSEEVTVYSTTANRATFWVF